MPLRSFFIRAFTLLFLSTVATHAALIPCATAENPQICSLCDILVLGNNLTNWFAGILLPLGILAFGISGVLYLIQKPDQAKSLMASAAKGIIISLSAFLVVNITLRALDVVQPTSWNTFTCTSQVAATPPKTDGTTFNTSGDGGPTDTEGDPKDIAGDPTITPTTPICNEGRDTSAIPMAVPLALTLNCTNPTNIVSAIWRFPSDSNFRTQNIDSAQVFRGGATSDTITFTTIENPSSWNDVTVVVTDNQGRSQTYTYGFGGAASGVASCNTTPYTGSYGGASARVDCTQAHTQDNSDSDGYGSLGSLGCTVNHTWPPGNLGIRPVSKGNGAFVIEYMPGNAGWGSNKYWTLVFTSQAPASSETRVSRLEVAISSQPNDFTSSNVIQKSTSTSRVDQGLLSYGEFSPLLIMPREYPHKLYINVRPTGYYDLTRGTYYADEELTGAQIESRGLGYPYQSFYIIPNFLPESYPGLENSCLVGVATETSGETKLGDCQDTPTTYSRTVNGASPISTPNYDIAMSPGETLSIEVIDGPGIKKFPAWQYAGLTFIWGSRDLQGSRDFSISRCRGDFGDSSQTVMSSNSASSPNAAGRFYFVGSSQTNLPTGLDSASFIVRQNTGGKWYINVKHRGCLPSSGGVDRCTLFYSLGS